LSHFLDARKDKGEILLTFLYNLFGIPRTPEEFVRKAAKEHDKIAISYKTEQSEVQPEGNFSPYLSTKSF
jgi:hypothetical protein